MPGTATPLSARDSGARLFHGHPSGSTLQIRHALLPNPRADKPTQLGTCVS